MGRFPTSPSTFERMRPFLFLAVFRLLIIAVLPVAEPAVDTDWPGRQQAATQVPDPHTTPAPSPTSAPVPPPAPNTEPAVTTQIFKVVFSADTLTEAIAMALDETSRREVESLSGETAQLTSILGELLRPPDDGHFAAIGAASLPTAAVLAPALFLLRLALHHWRRLMGEEEGLLIVVGDWVTAGFTAAAAGPVLDLLVQTGWWAAGAALGETAALARDFLFVSLVTNVLRSMGRPSMFTAVFAIGGGLGGLLGVAGLGFAFAVTQAVLFVLAAVAPVVSVAAVLPQMRWLRGLWLKAASVLALIPVAAGSIFKAAVVLAVSFGGGGFAELLMRLLWLWGAVGFLLSLAGVLGRMTLSTAVESAGRFAGGVRSVVSIGLQAAGAAPVGAIPGSAPPGMIGAGLQGAGAVQPIGIRQAGEAGAADFSALAPHFTAAGLDPQWARSNFPDETARMAAIYHRNPAQVDAAAEPLREAARMANAAELLSWIEHRGGRA